MSDGKSSERKGETCPTCRSKNPEYHGWLYGAEEGHRICLDPWHRGDTAGAFYAISEDQAQEKIRRGRVLWPKK